MQRAELPEEVSAMIYNEDQLQMALGGGSEGAQADQSDNEEIEIAEEVQDTQSSSNASFFILEKI